jgi:tetratricopeptide (TPR) repeat protein
MAANYAVSPELTTFVESLIRPSVVLVLLDDKPTQTGFFVSRAGLVCTCYHGFPLYSNSIASIRWNGCTYPADIVHSSPEEDLVILGVRDFGDTAEFTQSLPISAETIPATEHRHRALSLGYGGLETYGIPEAARMFVGDLSVRYDTEQQQRFETYLLGAGKGHSGAPVMDLHRFRVLGYVRASYAANSRLNGDALTFKSVIAAFPDLEDEWRQVCREFDLKLAASYRKSPFPLDLNQCPGDLITALVSEHIADVFAGHRDQLFQLNRYAPRAVESNILGFLEESTRPLLLLSGASGSGKTSLLLNLTKQIDQQRYLPLLIKCQGLKTRDLPGAAFKALLPAEHFDLPRLGQLLARVSDRTWVLFFDGLNECADFSSSEFEVVVDALWSIIEMPGVSVKVLFSVRAEFLREHLPAFFWQGARQDDAGSDLLKFFQSDERGQPYLSVGCINSTQLPDNRLELEAMYDQYRQTGLKPNTTFAQLTKPIIELLDRPFVLELMMTIYHGAEIPLNTGRSNLLRIIVRQTLEKAGIATGVRANQMGVYLGALAAFILKSQGGLSCLDSDIYYQPWHKGDELEVLLSGTPFLERESVQRSFTEESIIRFSADWTLEFFLARFLWGEWWRNQMGKESGRQISELHELLSQETAGINLPHLLMALVFFAEWAATDDPIRFSFLVKVMNDSSQESFAKGFTRECLDFFRITYGFNNEIQSTDGAGHTTLVKLLSDNAEHFKETGGEALLDYVDYLETIGEANDVLVLLNVEPFRLSIAGNEQLEARRNISLALATFDRHDIEGALSFAAKVDSKKLPSDLMAKHSFVVGRAYQFKRDFARAEQAYEVGREQSSRYAYRCEHQLSGFLPIMTRSDFVSTLDRLEHVLEDTSFGLTREERFASMLLRATSLVRLGRYAKAEVQLQEIIRLRTIQRHKQGLGIALRALAEMHFRKFGHQPAQDVIGQALETLEGRTYYLSLASTYDTQSNILGLLTGDLTKASACNQESLELGRKAKHESSIRWFLQTTAMLLSLKGEVSGAREVLEQAGATNPYEKLRRRFILLLARHCGEEGVDHEIKTEIRELQSDFRQLQLAWYPGVLSLIYWAASGIAPSQERVAAEFPENTDMAGVFNSYLFARIFAAR